MIWFGRPKIDARGLHMNACNEVDLIRRKFLQNCLVIGKYSCCSPRIKFLSIYQKRGIYVLPPLSIMLKTIMVVKNHVVNLVIDAKDTLGQ